MRIAYLAPYQGKTLMQRRPILANRSLATNAKIELLAPLLKNASHDLEIIALGEVGKLHLRFYPAFNEAHRFHPDIPIHYLSTFPVRFFNGYWSSRRALSFLKQRHRAAPYDIVIIYNLKGPHLSCAHYAVQHLGIPVILEYEDDSFVTVGGQASKGMISSYHDKAGRSVLKIVAGCIAVSPYLLAQLPPTIPKMLLRGVVGDDLVREVELTRGKKQNRVLFSGTHTESNGIAQLIKAWQSLALPDWELHITGEGKMTSELRRMAQRSSNIIFHGLVSRGKLINLLSSAKICINPHTLSKTPGNVFAFKLIEYLAAGAHVITTPMGALESELESGISYISDNAPATIAKKLVEIIRDRRYDKTAAKAAQRAYGAAAVSGAMEALLQQAMNANPLSAGN